MKYAIALWLALVAPLAHAMQGYSVALGVMALTNSTQQGGQGSAGSTILTQTNATYHSDWWGAGAFVQYNKQGEHETDFAAGPRLELTFDPFYVELGYAVMMTRSFTDRSIEEQSGKSYTLGLGARFPLGTGPTFLQFSYSYSTQIVEKQDGAKLDEPITQVDGYPLFGAGVAF